MARTICNGISSFLVMDILEKAQELEKAGEHIIHLEVGQPDFSTPECITEAAIKALRDGKTAYSHSLGILPLREAIASYYEREYGVFVSPERIVVTNGTSPAMLLLFSALFDPGDTVIVPDPTYACYNNFINYTQATIRSVPTFEQNGFQLHIEDVADSIDAQTRAILINSPSNPAGTLISPDGLKNLCNMGPILISDEIYHGLVYEGCAASALEFNNDACVLDGFSKRYAMTGWRLGWMVVPEHFIPVIQRLQQNFFICASSIAQWAGITALNEAKPDVERMAAEYNRRRHILLDSLRKLGFVINSDPVGAFYVLVNAQHLSRDSLALAYDILEKAGVGVAPGIDFGSGAEGYIRFSYANSVENIEEAMYRLGKYLQTR